MGVCWKLLILVSIVMHDSSVPFTFVFGILYGIANVGMVPVRKSAKFKELRF